MRGGATRGVKQRECEQAAITSCCVFVLWNGEAVRPQQGHGMEWRKRFEVIGIKLESRFL